MKIDINGINHVAISVADFEESIGWYQRVFGFEVLDRSQIPGTGIQVAHMQGTGFLLEIFCAPNSNPLPPERRIPNQDLLTQGNKHFSFGVMDAHQAKEDMEKMGVEIAFVAEVDGTYGVFIRDNTGNLIEIFEEGDIG
ncbi:MAG: VOC family protein [Lachnospiraceae bacterium]|nr:VOC family protein [Lachnospiraceae bacterium]